MDTMWAYKGQKYQDRSQQYKGLACKGQKHQDRSQLCKVRVMLMNDISIKTIYYYTKSGHVKDISIKIIHNFKK